MLLNPTQARRPDERESGYVLLTGVTGLLGRYLLRELIVGGCGVAVVARGSRKLSAVQRVEQVMQMWDAQLGELLPRPIVLEGDVTSENFGLTSAQQRWLRRHCSALLHNAAVVEFRGPSSAGEPWRTNLEGTRNALRLACRLEIPAFHYLSTAYVCGARTDIIYEHELDCGQTFRNDYERSKFEAESLVRQHSGQLPSVTIYRPAVIAGDSQTGYTSTYHGLFVYLRLMSLLVPQQPRDEHGVIQTPVRLPLRGDEPRNVVPVDWVSQVVCHLYRTPAAHGRTYHLAPDIGITARQLIEYCYEYFNSSGVEFVGAGQGTQEDCNTFARLAIESSAIYRDYETSDPIFDTSNLRKVAPHLAAPRITREMVHRYLRFGEADRWGKRKPTRPHVACWAVEQMPHIVSAANLLWPVLKRGKLREPACGLTNVPGDFGIDVIGPGGGQWRLRRGRNGYFFEPGLPADQRRVIRLTSQTLAELAASASQLNGRHAKAWADALGMQVAQWDSSDSGFPAVA